MKNKECYKCGGIVTFIKKDKYPIIMINYWSDTCLLCQYKYNPILARKIMPFTKLELEKIRDGKKWTSLRKAIPKYSKYPFERKKVTIEFNRILGNYGNNITNKIIKSEGFDLLFELITALKKKGFKLPQEFWLYNL